ncbi:modifier of mdg4-like isoform X10 [Anopheles bellator]|uniref:modifier of mdg4-like isoform X10 n=1 Tax=Anopheles bellator TaxID=139047 RepID=UPI002647B6EB|nr:modifier of mdg4-like isoform X10 [Anopheles bellator]
MADDEQFSLCWNNFNTNLSAGFHESLVQGDLVDVTLAAEGQLVKAHRLILSVCSPYFRKMFTQMPVNQHAFIFLKDVSHSALKDLIQFMYCGEVNVKQDALPAFISTAEALQIKGLTETGDSAPPPQPSPAKENIPTTPAPVSISTNTGSPRGKVQRSRVQSYKLESEESGDDKIVQIQSSTSHHSATGSQQAQQIQQVHVASGQKRILGQRILAPSMTNKRAKLSVSGNDMLDPSEATTQIQTVQIVKQLPSQTTEPEYVEMALEPISTKAEPDYSEEHTEIETVEAETEQDQSLAEHDQSADQEQGDDEGTYVEDEAYGDMSKYEESYFTEGEEGKAGVSGFAEPYTSDGTGNEQAAQGSSTSYVNTVWHQYRTQLPEYTYKQSQRSGRRLLVVNGVTFFRNRQRINKQYWKCSQYYKCRCPCIAVIEEQTLQISLRHCHNHDTTTKSTTTSTILGGTGVSSTRGREKARNGRMSTSGTAQETLVSERHLTCSSVQLSPTRPPPPSLPVLDHYD